ncbi:response regulator [Microvirga arabica]|nr:response regulator [Microvirga arabica]
MVQDAECTRVALVVENNKDLRALAVALLEETDLRVVEASSAEQAVQYLCYNAGDVAFLFSDVKLPCVMDGVDLARTVRLKWPWIRTVLTSDAPPANDLDKALRHVRFMQKPWLPLSVLMEAERAVQAYRCEGAMLPGHTDTFATARL